MAEKLKSNYVITNCLKVKGTLMATIQNDLGDVIPTRYHLVQSQDGLLIVNRQSFSRNTYGINKNFDKVSFK